MKAFDSIQHDILYPILKKYGLPLSLFNVINKMYQNCHVHQKIRKNLERIPYKTGVQQGDNMAPILFLFVMQAVMDTLDKDLPANNLKPEFQYFPNDKGHLIGQRTKSAGSPFNVFSLLFIDDGAFLFQS